MSLKQELELHKLYKERQIGDMQDQLYKLRDFKQILERQIRVIQEHTDYNSQATRQKLYQIMNQLEGVKEPILNEISNLTSQKEMMEREIERS